MATEMTIDQVKQEVKSSVSEAVTKAFDPKALSEQLAVALKEAMKAGVAKSLVDEHGEEKVDKAVKGGRFFAAVLDRAMGKAIGDEILQTGASTQGGYLVPTTVANDIAQVETQASLARQYCTVFPHPGTAGTINLTTLTSGIAVTYPNETASGGDTEPVFGQRVFTLKRAVAHCPVTLDLLGTSPVNLYNWLVKHFGEQFALDLDTQAFTDVSSPYYGILNVAGKSKTLATGKVLADVTFDDLVDVQSELATGAMRNGKWVMSPSVFGRMRKLKDGQGTPIFLVGGLGTPSTFLDYPYLTSDVMPTAGACASANVKALFFGDLSKYYIGIGEELVVEASPVASLALDGGTVSAWQNALMAFRGMRRMSMNCAVLNAFSKLIMGA